MVKEFGKYVNPNKRWIHARSSLSANTDESDIKGVGHGTGVLAKAAGWKHGIAKRSNPVIVRVPLLGDPQAWLDGVHKTFQDWKSFYDRNVCNKLDTTIREFLLLTALFTQPKTATGVISMSWGHTRGNLRQGGLTTKEEQDDWIADLRTALNDCIAIGLLVSFGPVSFPTHHETCSSPQPIAPSGNAKFGEPDNPVRVDSPCSRLSLD